ncbi:MAG TPA: tRNA (adenosine(37)-N6)-dimethylallyltransferase MiaA [Cycloclasticus sp.]|nr:tRNA (adenosine(37)-N6)-dimethylallyltransferase MiaA [Cycloclasticus sp.]HIL91476.1 tRNA (adenosine(37)-N6)-dimethylallyltransferase MiaA [Cycloclasticus sp.]
MQVLPQAILLMGPTASGKTALGIELAKTLDGEIISVDSALVYRGMDIGTAKPDMGERDGVVHHLIDILEPTQAFSAGQFRQQALLLIDDILSRGKMPILVGGTMLYFHVLLNGMASLPDADEAIRRDIDQQAQQQGWDAVHKRLQEVDPVAAARIHLNDSQRIQRALEVYLISGRSQTDWIKDQANVVLSFNPIKLVIAPSDRAVLHEKIALRFDQMLNNGFIEEVNVLFNRGDLDASMPAVRAVGYRQAWAYLQGDCDAATFREKAIIATRQLAKRQFTWLRQQAEATWLETGDDAVLTKALCQLG